MWFQIFSTFLLLFDALHYSDHTTQTTHALSVLPYNMHGFNQGCSFLKGACDENVYSVLFIQEFWLGPNQMDKLLNISEKYVGFGVSAMETALSIGLLRGRPFGGSAILVHKSFANACADVNTSERFSIVKICDTLFVNLYMPCEDGSLFSLNILHEMLGNLSNAI